VFRAIFETGISNIPSISYFLDLRQTWHTRTISKIVCFSNPSKKNKNQQKTKNTNSFLMKFSKKSLLKKSKRSLGALKG
jgi:hypothetical protein